MYQRIERPLTRTERRQLEKELGRLSRPAPMVGSGYFGCFGIFCGVFWLLTLAAAGRSALWPATLLWGVLFLGFPVVIDLKDAIARPKRNRDARSAIGELLERNLASEERVEATSMIAFEEIEDLGRWYAYQVEPDLVLFLSIGQEYAWDRRVRCDAFSVVHVGRYLSYVSKRGGPLEPVRVISVEAQEALGLGPGTPLPVGTVAGRLDGIEALLRAHATSRAAG